MSKIGKLPIDIPENTEVLVDDTKVKISGPKGSIEKNVPEVISVETKDGKLFLKIKNNLNTVRDIYGTTRAILANAVKGVSVGWSKTMELVGTGYRAETTGRDLTLILGFSHPVKFSAPEGITFKVEKSEITVEGVDRETVGLVCANIRKVRPPEPYKGKGIKFKGEVIRRKAGKAAKAAGS